MERLTFDNRARRTITECPCGRSNKDGKFCPYKGFTDKGYCHSCGQTFLPKIENDKEDAWRHSDNWKRPMATPSVIAPSFIDPTTAKQTLQRYDENNFTGFLKTIFHNDTDVLNDVINRFSIATNAGGFRDSIGQQITVTNTSVAVAITPNSTVTICQKDSVLLTDRKSVV